MKNVTEGKIYTSVKEWEKEFFPNFSERKEQDQALEDHVAYGILLANEALQKIKIQLSKFE